MMVLLGLFVGKQAGVFGFSWLVIKLRLASMPAGSSWRQVYSVSVMTGKGFTMSLFIDSLAFQGYMAYQYADKLAVLAGSFLYGLTGYLVLKPFQNSDKIWYTVYILYRYREGSKITQKMPQSFRSNR